MVVPNYNPDGMDMEVNNYLKYKGTKYEGCSLPSVYHKSAGHDNNRDLISLTQEDTKAINAIFCKTWFPQVMVEKHQMGQNGPRYFHSTFPAIQGVYKGTHGEAGLSCPALCSGW